MNKLDQPETLYPMGFSARETRRLQMQAQLLLPATRQFLKRAGLRAGMRVLDIGSGAGDVTLLVSKIVGPRGSVVGVENDPAILAIARARVEKKLRTNVSFVREDITHLEPDDRFDMIVGRTILQHLDDPATVLRHLLRYLHPGGVMAFQEIDCTHLGTSVPGSTPFEQIGDWVRQAFQSAGRDGQIGLRLPNIFLNAGLPMPQIDCVTTLGTGPEWAWYEVIVETVRSLMPIIVAHGIATEDEIAITTLEQRCRNAAFTQRGVVMGPDIVSAWARFEAPYIQ